MGIVIKHSGNASATLVGAYGGGQGQRQAQDARQAMELADRERSRAVAARQAQLDRTQRAILAAKEAKQRKELIAEGRQFQVERDEAAQKWAVENRLAESQQRRDDFVFQLTTQQKAELDKLATAEAEVMNSDDYTDEEKAAIRKQIQEKRLGIEPVARPRPKTPAEKFEESTYRDPKTGRVYPLDENGVPGRPIHEPPESKPSWQDRIKGFQAATTFATGPDGTVDPAKFEDAMRRMGLGEDQAAAGGQGQQPANQWVFAEATAQPAKGGAVVTPGTMQPIAGVPGELWSTLSEEDQQDAWTLFKSGTPLGQVVGLIKQLDALRRKQPAGGSSKGLAQPPAVTPAVTQEEPPQPLPFSIGPQGLPMPTLKKPNYASFGR